MLPMPSKETIESDISDAKLTEIQVYSDGSRVNNSSGYGYLVKQGRVVVTEGKGAAGRRTEVYDAEIMGAAAGLEAAVNSPAANLASGITVWLDNHAAASLLADGRTAPSRPIESELFRSLKRQWEATPGLLSKDSVKVRWLPGHADIEGNERADQLAKEGATLPNCEDIPSQAFLQREAKQWQTAKQTRWWESEAPTSYRHLRLSLHTRRSRKLELGLPRQVYGRLLAARTGHGDFKAYHDRFDHVSTTGDCSCGRPTSSVHFFFCRKAKRRWKGWKVARCRGPKATIDWILGTTDGALEFAEFSRETKFFTDVCPSHSAQTRYS